MRKLAMVILTGALAAAVMGTTANAEEIKVWVADNVVDFTNEQIEAFKEANPDYAGYDYGVEPVGEGDAAGSLESVSVRYGDPGQPSGRLVR